MNPILQKSSTNRADELTDVYRNVTREVIQNIAVGPDRGRDVSREAAAQVMKGILGGHIDDVQAAVFLIALRMKRESIDEFLGIFDALLSSIDSVTAQVDEIITLADPFDGYLRHLSMTPFIPAVLAACGYSCVIHGVKTVGPKHGLTANKLFTLAGIDTQSPASSVAKKLEVQGWGYVDQSVYSPELYNLLGLRDRIIKRTALTTLERLIAPIRGRLATHLVLGYVHKAYPQIYATVAKQAAYRTVLLLKGVEGGLAPALNKPLRRFLTEDSVQNMELSKQVDELPVSVASSSAAMLAGSGEDIVHRCLEEGLAVLGGAKSIARDSLCLASGQILNAHQADLSLADAVEKIQRCLDNGSAKARFDMAVGSAS